MTKSDIPESSPDISWLNTNTTGTTPSKSGSTPLTLKSNFPSISELDPNLLKNVKTNLVAASNNKENRHPEVGLSPSKLFQKTNLENPNYGNGIGQIKSGLLNIYDNKISDLQNKLINNERAFLEEKNMINHTNHVLLANNDLEIDRLRSESNQMKDKIQKLIQENKKYFAELTNLKSEMMILGSEPVDSEIIQELKNRGNLTVRQIAECRLHDILRPIYLDLKEKNLQNKRLYEKCKNFEQICADSKISIEGVNKMKNEYTEQITRNRLEMMDLKNQLNKYENLSKVSEQNAVKLAAANDAINSLQSQLKNSESSHHQELNYRIKAEKELAVVKEQLNLVSSDKKYLEGDKITYMSKLNSLESDLRRFNRI